MIPKKPNVATGPESDEVLTLTEGSQPSLFADRSIERVIEVTCLHFRVGSQRYGVPLASVHEILRMRRCAPVPRAPKAVRGVISVRGTVTTVIDLKRVLSSSGAAEERAARQRILLVQTEGEVVGLLSSEVFGVLRLTKDELEAEPPVGGDIGEFVTGIGRPVGQGDMVILLDPSAIVRRACG